MINRVTQQTVHRSTLANLQLNLSKMSDLQGQMSSGKRIDRASDDPVAAGRAMAYRAEKAAAEQAATNAADGASWLNQIDSTLQSSVSALRRVRDLTVQASSTGVHSDTSREAIAAEIEGLRDALLGHANTRINGRSVFAGTSAASSAFEDSSSATPYSWNGIASTAVTRRISADTTVRVDVDGTAAYGVGASSVFQTLDDLAAEIRAGDAVSGRLDDIDAHLDSMLSTLTTVGARYNQITDAQDLIAAKLQDLGASISTVEDIDIAQAVLELQMQEVAYQGALGAASRVLQPTLLDYLR
ncbi:flagellar hook-associated protein FlgL [Demequina mangrovi]|uniref:Flagellar hook-associated protein 3 FlgL n=1 Tax=Demequina mangrovi TaxID=1043493 RepID=A0A1H6ZTA6_9MICO|nr:flagellar hook-associated protein FlgL [Demequina mangrovi]SEJ56581.1 flagellar hook-associated protein 3 FlgL [Demequina mangrovi]